MRGKPSRLRGDLDIHCLGIAPGAVHWTTLRKAGLAFCAVMSLTGSACFWWLGESAEWYRGEIICHSRIPVVAGNPPPWLAEVSVAPMVRMCSTGSDIRFFPHTGQERLPYRLAAVNDTEARERLALLPAADQAAIKWAMDQLVAYYGPRDLSARNIGGVKARIERALARLAETGAAARLRRALLGDENRDDMMILRLEDDKAYVRFIVLMKGKEVLAGANEVSSLYYAVPDMRDGRFRPGVESDPTVDLLGQTWHEDDWTNILYSLARPTEELPEKLREAMDTWCREPVGVRK